MTNPTPGTQSEINIATFLNDEKPEYTITQYAKPEPDQAVMTQSLISNEVKEAVAEFFPDERMSFPAQMLIVTGDKPN